MSSNIFAVFAFVSLLVLSGCMATDAHLSTERINRVQTASLSTSEGQSESRTVSKASTDVLILDEALALSLMNNPELSAFSWEIRARDALRIQAALLPNPELSFEVENFLGTSGFNGMDQSESTLILTQRFEMAGKRGRREKLAALRRDLAGWDYESKRLDLFTQVSQHFITVLGNQKKVALSEDLLKLAKQVVETVNKRVDAGKVSPIERIKADVTLSFVEIDLGRSKRALHISRLELAALWGSDAPQFQSVSGRLRLGRKLPVFESLVSRLAKNPKLARWQTELFERKSLVELARANAIPDVSFGGGFRQFSETDDNALVASFSIDLPIFDRNQGRIREAKAQYSKGIAEQQSVALKLKSGLAEAYQRLSTARGEALILQTHLLPSAEKVFEAVNEGYRLGKFDLLDVFDAQRILSQAKTRLLAAQIAYQKALAAVEGLIAGSLEATDRSPKKK